MNDPTLSRPMFQQNPSAASPAMPSMGIGGMTTPDQNAMALRNMFSPQAFRGGGEVINGVKHFLGGGENVVTPPPAQEDPETARILGGGNPRPPQEMRKTPEEIQRAADQEAETARILGGGNPRPPQDARKTAEELRRAADQEAETKRILEGGDPHPVQNLRIAAKEVIATPPSSNGILSLPADATIKAMQDSYSNPNPNNLPMPALGGTPLPNTGAADTKPPPKPPGDQELTIESIRARREASEKQREQNKWMGILAAGLGMMASKSKTAAGGIGEGGLQGLQTYAGLEKSRREDETQLRHEDFQKQQLGLQKQQFGLAQEQLAQQKQLTMAQIEKDPDTVRLYKALGGGDLQRGFQLVSSDKILESATKLANDYTADPTKRQEAQAYISQRIKESSGVRPGTGNAPPPGSPVMSASDFVAGKK
jgi:hypothetical protein